VLVIQVSHPGVKPSNDLIRNCEL